MKKKIAPLILGTLFVFISVSSYAETEEKGPFFWEVRKEGVENNVPFYALGTIHGGVVLEELQCANEISSRLGRVSILLSEGKVLSTLELIKIFIQRKQQKESSLTTLGFKDLSLEGQVFFKERFPSALLERLGLRIGRIEEASLPVLVGVYEFICLSNSPSVTEALMSVTEKSLDGQVMEIAKNNDTPYIYLDNGAEQRIEQRLAYVSQDLSSASLADLERVIHYYEEYCAVEVLENQYRNRLRRHQLQMELVGSYIAGEPLVPIIDEIMRKEGYSEELIEKSRADSEQAFKVRNEIWFPKITQAYREHDSIFVVAGSGHFTEAGNLLDMLRADGFFVKRYSKNCKPE